MDVLSEDRRPVLRLVEAKRMSSNAFTEVSLPRGRISFLQSHTSSLFDRRRVDAIIIGHSSDDERALGDDRDGESKNMLHPSANAIGAGSTCCHGDSLEI